MDKKDLKELKEVFTEFLFKSDKELWKIYAPDPKKPFKAPPEMVIILKWGLWSMIAPFVLIPILLVIEMIIGHK